MKKDLITEAGFGPGKMKNRNLTIGLDLGDRSSFYCVLDESGDVILERQVRNKAKALAEAFAVMPKSRIALETGTHSPLGQPPVERTWCRL
jgi:transposase